MKYHIDTQLLKEKFAKDTECPLCDVRKTVEDQIVYEFLNDAVMDDDMRIKVNKYGFCRHHFDLLFAGKNKLSLALQLSTRIMRIKGEFSSPKNIKSAKKLAEQLRAKTKTCVICDILNDSMEKYYKAVAMLYKKEPEFRNIIKNGKGFCLEHFSCLLENASESASFSKEYLQTLSDLFYCNTDRFLSELDRFCKKHDYRNALMPLGSAETVLPRTGDKLYGKKNIKQ